MYECDASINTGAGARAAAVVWCRTAAVTFIRTHSSRCVARWYYTAATDFPTRTTHNNYGTDDDGGVLDFQDRERQCGCLMGSISLRVVVVALRLLSE